MSILQYMGYILFDILSPFIPTSTTESLSEIVEANFKECWWMRGYILEMGAMWIFCNIWDVLFDIWSKKCKRQNHERPDHKHFFLRFKNEMSFLLTASKSNPTHFYFFSSKNSCPIFSRGPSSTESDNTQLKYNSMASNNVKLEVYRG